MTTASEVEAKGDLRLLELASDITSNPEHALPANILTLILESRDATAREACLSAIATRGDISSTTVLSSAIEREQVRSIRENIVEQVRLRNLDDYAIVAAAAKSQEKFANETSALLLQNKISPATPLVRLVTAPTVDHTFVTGEITKCPIESIRSVCLQILVLRLEEKSLETVGIILKGENRDGVIDEVLASIFPKKAPPNTGRAGMNVLYDAAATILKSSKRLNRRSNDILVTIVARSTSKERLDLLREVARMRDENSSARAQAALSALSLQDGENRDYLNSIVEDRSLSFGFRAVALARLSIEVPKELSRMISILEMLDRENDPNALMLLVYIAKLLPTTTYPKVMKKAVAKWVSAPRHFPLLRDRLFAEIKPVKGFAGWIDSDLAKALKTLVEQHYSSPAKLMKPAELRLVNDDFVFIDRLFDLIPPNVFTPVFTPPLIIGAHDRESFKAYLIRVPLLRVLGS